MAWRAKRKSILLERVGDESEDFLVFVQQQHGPQVAKSFVCEAVRREQLDTLNLSKMRPLAERKQIPCNKQPAGQSTGGCLQ